MPSFPAYLLRELPIYHCPVLLTTLTDIQQFCAKMFRLVAIGLLAASGINVWGSSHSGELVVRQSGPYVVNGDFSEPLAGTWIVDHQGLPGTYAACSSFLICGTSR